MDKPEQGRFEVIAVGSSAGGLHALQRFVTLLPASLPVPIVIVQHLSPSYASMMAHILRRYTDLDVKQVEAGDIMSAGCVYIAPPDRHVLFGEGGQLVLSETERIHFVRPSVDVLFESLAEQYGERAIAVVLTGAGRDGASGLRAVKDAGGVTIVQNPKTADHASMPQSAIDTAGADHIVDLDRIPALLIELVTHGDAL